MDKGKQKEKEKKNKKDIDEDSSSSVSEAESEEEVIKLETKKATKDKKDKKDKDEDEDEEKKEKKEDEEEEEDDPDKVLNVYVQSASNLPGADRGKKADPYCVVTWQDEKHKTLKIRKTLTPVWNQKLIFELAEGWERSVMKFELFDWDLFTKHDPLGEIEVDFTDLVFTKKKTVFTFKDQKLDHPVIETRGKFSFALEWAPRDKTGQYKKKTWEEGDRAQYKPVRAKPDKEKDKDKDKDKDKKDDDDDKDKKKKQEEIEIPTNKRMGLPGSKVV